MRQAEHPQRVARQLAFCHCLGGTLNYGPRFAGQFARPAFTVMRNPANKATAAAPPAFWASKQGSAGRGCKSRRGQVPSDLGRLYGRLTPRASLDRVDALTDLVSGFWVRTVIRTRFAQCPLCAKSGHSQPLSRSSSAIRPDLIKVFPRSPQRSFTGHGRRSPQRFVGKDAQASDLFSRCRWQWPLWVKSALRR
jgi:hypothetical protein